MKTQVKTLTLLSLFAIISLGPTRLQAQEKSVGAALVYGTDIKSVGLQAQGQYFFTENWAASPSLVYFLPKSYYQDFKMKWFELNLNANYYFTIENENIRPYATGGLGLSFISMPTTYSFFDEDVKNTTYTEVGLNLGGGADFVVSDNLRPFGELRYAINGFGQLSIVGGVRYTF